MIPEDISKTIQKSFTQVADSAAHIPTQHLSKLAELSRASLDNILKNVTGFVIEIALKIVLVLVIYYAGRWAIRWIKRFTGRVMTRRHVDVSLQKFLLSLLGGFLTGILILGIVGVLGINTTSLVAIFGAAGLGIGMAMSGTLQNFAGGVMILILKPYHLGDFIEAQGQSGTVKDIRLFNTVVNTGDNKTIFIPNGAISTGIINNYSAEPNRRVEWNFGVVYDSNIEQIRRIVLEILRADKRILRDRECLVAVNTLADNSVRLVVRAWVPSAEFWNVYFSVNEIIYNTLPANGISFSNNSSSNLEVTIKNKN